MQNDAVVYVVDDDQAVRQALRLLMQSVGVECRTFAVPQDLLLAYDPDKTSCLISDIRMPGMSGLELQAKLREHDIDIPLIIVTAHGDVRTAVRAMRAGAVDFIEKPFNDQTLLDCVHHALRRDAERRTTTLRRRDAMSRVNRLSAREREVLTLLVAGKSNKVIAHDLGVSHKTVETHRANLMAKMRVRSIVELTRVVCSDLRA